MKVLLVQLIYDILLETATSTLRSIAKRQSNISAKLELTHAPLYKLFLVALKDGIKRKTVHCMGGLQETT